MEYTRQSRRQSLNTKVQKACFIVPCYLKDSEGVRYLHESLSSLKAQKDQDWVCVVINDNPSGDIFESAINAYTQDSRFYVITNPQNMGPGICRNKGVQFSHEMGIDLVIFQDADDVAASDRLSYVVDSFQSNLDVDVVYGRFNVIDENSHPVADSALSFSIREIIGANKDGRVTGFRPWKEMATLTGYCNLTSATAVRTSFALRYPFPIGQVSEDYKTWLAYATGGAFYFDGRIHCSYRIPQGVQGSATREREGPKEFYSKKMVYDKIAFDRAVELAMGENWLITNEYKALLARHYMKSFETVYGEGFIDYSKEAIVSAVEVLQEILRDLEND